MGCLRPPCGGTDACVPSRIFKSACCTPSPETSRVIDGLSALRAILSTSSDVDNYRLGLLDVVVGRLDQLQQDVLDVLADVAGLGQRGRVGDREGHVRIRASVWASSVLPQPVGPSSRMFDFCSSMSVSAGHHHLHALVVVVDGHDNVRLTGPGRRRTRRARRRSRAAWAGSPSRTPGEPTAPRR